MMKESLKIISGEQVDELVKSMDIETIVGLAAQSFYVVSNKLDQTPHRLKTNNDNYTALYMTSYVPDIGEAVKIVGIPTRSNGLQSTNAILDPSNGAVKWIVNSKVITALRTAAGSALATKTLAKPDAKVLLVFGSGAQAYWHIKLMLMVRPTLSNLIIFSRTLPSVDKLKATIVKEFPNLKTTTQSIYSDSDKLNLDTIKESLSESDIICSCTPSQQPFLFGDSIKPGTHLNCVGSYTESMQEFDLITIKRSTLYVDSVEMTLLEAGEFISAKKQGHQFNLLELGQSITTPSSSTQPSDYQFKPSPTTTTSPPEFTLFKSVGVGAQDTIFTQYLCQLAQTKGSYTDVPFQ